MIFSTCYSSIHLLTAFIIILLINIPPVPAMIIERIHPQVIKYAVMKLKTIATNAMISTVTTVLFFHHLTQVDILIYSCPRTDVKAVVLTEVAHVTIARVHAVRVVRRVLRTRPIVGG